MQTAISLADPESAGGTGMRFARHGLTLAFAVGGGVMTRWGLPAIV